MDYPRRPPFFAMKAIRLMVKACVANAHGPQVFALLATVAATEDSRKYLGAVTFYDLQIAPLVGANSRDTLGRVRDRAVASGWLSYTPGRKGVPGRYFITIPPDMERFTDGPVDEAPGELAAGDGGRSGRDSSAPVRQQPRRIATATAQQPHSNRTASRQHVPHSYTSSSSCTSPSPIEPASQAGGMASTKMGRRSAPADDPRFVEFWLLYPRKVKKEDARKAFAKLGPDPDLFGVMMTALAAQKGWPKWLKDDGEFIPHPTTWLNGRRWEDEAGAVGPPARPDPGRGSLADPAFRAAAGLD